MAFEENYKTEWNDGVYAFILEGEGEVEIEW